MYLNSLGFGNVLTSEGVNDCMDLVYKTKYVSRERSRFGDALIIEGKLGRVIVPAYMYYSQ